MWMFVRRDILTIKSMLEWLLGRRVHACCACDASRCKTMRAVHNSHLFPLERTRLFCLPHTHTAQYYTCRSYVNDESFLLWQVAPRSSSLQIHERMLLPQPYMPGLLSLPPEDWLFLIHRCTDETTLPCLSIINLFNPAASGPAAHTFHTHTHTHILSYSSTKACMRACSILHMFVGNKDYYS